jgi:hypothetical protein
MTSLENLMHTGSHEIDANDSHATIKIAEAQNIISQARGGAAFRD